MEVRTLWIAMASLLPCQLPFDTCQFIFDSLASIWLRWIAAVRLNLTDFQTERIDFVLESFESSLGQLVSARARVERGEDEVQADYPYGDEDDVELITE